MTKSCALLEFDPAIEEIINRQFAEGRCCRKTKINMMIGKLCQLYREYGRLEISEHKFDEDSFEKEKLENRIEMLSDDISKELYLGFENKKS